MVTTKVMDMQDWPDARKIREASSVSLAYRMRSMNTVVEITKKEAYRLAYWNARAEREEEKPQLKFLIDAQFDLKIVPAREA